MVRGYDADAPASGAELQTAYPGMLAVGQGGVDQPLGVAIVVRPRPGHARDGHGKVAPRQRAHALGHRAGERVQVEMENGRSYYLEILSIEKGTDDDTVPIGSF